MDAFSSPMLSASVANPFVFIVNGLFIADIHFIFTDTTSGGQRHECIRCGQFNPCRAAKRGRKDRNILSAANLTPCAVCHTGR